MEHFAIRVKFQHYFFEQVPTSALLFLRDASGIQKAFNSMRLGICKSVMNDSFEIHHYTLFIVKKKKYFLQQFQNITVVSTCIRLLYMQLQGDIIVCLRDLLEFEKPRQLI
jgi:hypothetical protein